jgi:protein phosphatase
VHQGQIFRITRDHSIVQELVDRGVLTAQQAAHHPDANRITRALGMGPEVEVEIRPQPVHHVAGDTFVLCSDGLSDLVEDSEIAEVIGNHPAAQAVGKLVDLANARGGHDNITVVVLRARESALAAVGAITPTVVQTAVAQDSATVPASAPTVVDAPQRTVHAHSLASRPLEPTPPPLSSVRGSSPRGKLMVVAGLTLAAIAIALISTVIAAELAELRGKRNSSHTTSAPEFGIPPDAGGDAPSPLLPESVVIPMPSTPPGGSIAPLESSSAGPPRRRRVQ